MAELKLDIEQRQTLERQLRFQLQEKKDEVGELCTKLNLCRLCPELNICGSSCRRRKTRPGSYVLN